MIRSKPGHSGRAAAALGRCGRRPLCLGGVALISVGFGCSIDNRPSRLVTPESGNEESSTAPASGEAGAAAANAPPSGSAAPPGSSETSTLPLGGSSASGSPGRTEGDTQVAGSSAGTGGAASAPSGGAAGAAAGPDSPAMEPVEPIGGCFQQLLANAGFEQGHAAWTEVSELRDVIVGSDATELAGTGVAPQAGTYLAWIGGLPNGEFLSYETTLRQLVSIPAETLSLTFSGYAWVAQSDRGQMPFDWAVLEADDPDPSVPYLWQVQLWSEQNVTDGWVYFENTWTDVAWMAGRTIEISVDSRPMGRGTLSVWLDSLRLEARCPR